MKEIAPSKLEKVTNRRDFLKKAVTLTTGLTLLPQTQETMVLAEDLPDKLSYDLPVSTTEIDSRLKSIQPTTVTLSDGLKQGVFYSQPPIESVELNPVYSSWEAKNRLNLSMANTLIRAHALASTYIEGENHNYSALERMLQSGDSPSNPDWSKYEYLLNETSDELTFPVMSIPLRSTPDLSNLEWATVDVRKGINLNFISEPGLIRMMYTPSDEIATSCTLRTSEDNQLQLDIFPNMDVLPVYTSQAFPNATLEELYDLWGTFTTLQSMDVLDWSLGIFTIPMTDNALFQRDFGSNRFSQIKSGSSFGEQQDIMVGGDPQMVGLKNLVLNFNTAKT